MELTDLSEYGEIDNITFEIKILEVKSNSLENDTETNLLVLMPPEEKCLDTHRPSVSKSLVSVS